MEREKDVKETLFRLFLRLLEEPPYSHSQLGYREML